ncbi:hypothetical protein K503DRAFT_258589 [Rhizopogon vinicolor AM-OR11-026]|uniref:Uncharacterized protein n=1 Tax=Rhizopogon vinicolor AM-OR11-026 TaxID=1314800 RepID=A0A1B7MWS2_9AGAM|nr:hypothetical protein K503DRAFT_258589 [Rhizopogon vinicolor AM-OR11-026]
MSHQYSETLSPLSISTTCFIPSSPGFPSADTYMTFGSLSAGAHIASFDRFGPPKCQTSAKIWPGTFITFALSTEQLAQEYPDGSEIHRRIREYKPGRYLGLVTSSFAQSSDEDGSIVEDIIVHFVSTDTPQPSVVSDHFMPIFPISTSVPMDTSVLSTSILFPWVDRKQWTTFGVRLRICQRNTSGLVFELCHEDFERFEDKAGEDYCRLQNLDAFLGDEDKERLARLLVAPFALPAEIWLDIRNQLDIKDPPSFVEDIDFLESIVAGGMPRDN